MHIKRRIYIKEPRFHVLSVQIVIIMRGLPGSGKSHVAKLIRVGGTISSRHFMDSVFTRISAFAA